MGRSWGGTVEIWWQSHGAPWIPRRCVARLGCRRAAATGGGELRCSAHPFAWRQGQEQAASVWLLSVLLAPAVVAVVVVGVGVLVVV